MIYFKKQRIPDKFFSRKDLRAGMKHEKEHTNNRWIAKSIAKAHLYEDGNYYKKLRRCGL
jgi:hypothetical protein